MFELKKINQLALMLIFVFFLSGCENSSIIVKLKALDQRIGQELEKLEKGQPAEILKVEEVKKTEPVQLILNGETKAKIDDWLKAQSLNRYGDAEGTVYAGGTPLFDETTGEAIDRYEYILKNHPDLPADLNQKNE